MTQENEAEASWSTELCFIKSLSRISASRATEIMSREGNPDYLTAQIQTEQHEQKACVSSSKRVSFKDSKEISLQLNRGFCVLRPDASN